jgi:hypothetical protein
MNTPAKAAYLREYYRANKGKKQAYDVAYRAAKFDVRNAQKKNYYADSLPLHMLQRAKVRAAKNGIEFDLVLADIVIPDCCPILGTPLVVNAGGPGRSSPSLDRIDVSKGYVRGNVQVISYRANTMKNDAPPEELRQFATWVLAQWSTQ